MKALPIGRYTNYDTFLNRLDARFKLLAMILFMVVVFIHFGSRAMDFTFYGLLMVMVLVFMRIAHIRIRQLLRAIKPMWFMMIFLLIINVLVVQTGEAFYIGDFPIHYDALFNTLYTFVRLILMLAFSLILTATTKPMDLTYALEWYLHPLTFIKVPVHIIAMVISLALRFIPTLLEEADRFMKAQASRGVDFENGKLREKVRAIISLIIPLFVSAIQRSTDLADAMEVRGYDPNGKRTRYRIMHFAKRDVLSLFFLLAFFGGMLALSICGIDFYAFIL